MISGKRNTAFDCMMRNLIILGSGRSGTSAVAGLFRNLPGVFYGYEILPATPANQRGYFEDQVVNALNNLLLRRMTGVALLDLVPEQWLETVGKHFPWMHRDYRSLWIARPRRPLPWRLGWELEHLIGVIVRHEPFCLKDPRFTFTLPMWRPLLPAGTRFLVVFRHPAHTVSSMLRVAKEFYPDRPLALTPSWAFEHWRLAYERVLAQRQEQGGNNDWLYVRAEDVMSGTALQAIETFAECRVDASHLDARLFRAEPGSSGEAEAVIACMPLYERLCALSAEDLRREASRR
jgi:Sulfotransferase family